MDYRRHKNSKVYRLAYKLVMDKSEIRESFPKEERCSLTDQIKRLSRSIPRNIPEAWKKRIYPKMFVSEVIDAAGEVGGNRSLV